MSAYTYRPPRRYRRYSRSGSKGPVVAVAVLAALLAASGARAAHGGNPARSAAADAAATQAIAYARQQIGKPYQWGGTGPDTFDCSGLVLEAYASAGVNIARTSQEQWATESHVPGPQPGDLVFFAGADGTTGSPGHVGIVTGPHTMIEAYAPGYPVRYSTFGLPSSPPGDTDPAGFADPAARGGT